MENEKRGQFYIIAAVVIVFVIIGLGAVSNYVYVKKPPQKFYDLNKMLQSESLEVITYSAYSQENVNANIEGYLNAFKTYMEQNTQDDFDLIIIYGNAEAGSITARHFSRSSLEEGGVSINLGQQVRLSIATGDIVDLQNATVQFDSEQRTVNITIYGDTRNLTETFPVVEDNNFVFVMTTGAGFNEYVQTSASTQ